MKYKSTRGGIDPIPFKEAVMMGLANDGGLLLPETLPHIDKSTIDSWQNLSFQELSFAVLSLFISDIPAKDLKFIIDLSYGTFTHNAITPIKEEKPLHILELFHGPTLAFKDVALQFLGNIFEYILRETNDKMNILGATSGDTGSAAIYGVRGKDRINIFILHPYKRVSPIQELQMTTVADANVFNLAIHGTFDDGQSIVKHIFNDIPFKNSFHLGAVNSINWARILAQVVYYIFAWLHVSSDTGSKSIDFSVPTGNFGDIFAGYIAKRMLGNERINKLILATNENDLLARFISKGDYSKGTVVTTSSPSMDIQVASNFERYLYYLLNENPQKTSEAMKEFSNTSRLDFSNMLPSIAKDFSAKRVTESETIATIREFYDSNGYLLDPHSAVGVNAALSYQKDGNNYPIVCLATAHPAKFGEAVAKAIGKEPVLPPALADLQGKQARCQVIAAEIETVKEIITQNTV